MKGHNVAEVIQHPLQPIYDERSCVLVLGTMPSPMSRKVGFYYGHPQNRFWRVMERLFNLADHSLVENDARTAFLLAHRIALWDVLSHCAIKGASDASITEAAPNDLRYVLDRAPIRHVFTTGTKAYQLYHRLCEKDVGIPATPLPSTSAANARMRLDDLVVAYAPLKEALEATA